MKKEAVHPWSIPIKTLLANLNTSEKGLTAAEAEKRLEEYGPNDLTKKEERHGLKIFFSQVKNPLILILFFAIIVAYLLGEKINSLVILLMVSLNVFFGFFQEYRAEKTIRLLKKYISLKTKVIREGIIVELDSKEVVPGDLVYLHIGDIIPADLRLLRVDELTTDESSLTGESVPVNKKIELISTERDLPQELLNVAFMGTSVVGGYGHGVVIATGEKTVFGKTAAYLKRKEPEADFQKSIHKFSNFLLQIILGMTLFIFLANALLGKGYLISFMFALALAVGITPEILPVIMTITLSNGALQMAREKVITKRLSSVEDLGNIDTLCCDKTGTLTEGKVTLEKYLNLEGKPHLDLVLYGMLCNSAQGISKSVFENPIDKALWESPQAHTLKEEVNNYTFLDENEFDFVRRRVSVLLKEDSRRHLLLVKGAPEAVLKVSKSAQIKNKIVHLDAELLRKITKEYNDYEKDGYKVIALAKKELTKSQTTKKDEFDLIFLGFLLFLDPPKKQVKEAILLFEKLGINIKVISGDSPLITRKICKDVNLVINENRVITGDDLEKLSALELEEYAQKYNVFARVTPEQKYNIVASLNKEGHIVGFLGDGINDAPALKAADVGISVDTATSIAKEAADIILTKKSLHVLADGILQGRKIFGNITKYILNTISANYGNMFTVALSSLFMKFIPLLPAQILLNNFISDVPNLTISTDNVDPELLHKPRRWNLKLISRFMVYFGLISSFFDLLLIFSLLFLFKAEIELFRSAWFVESVLSEIIVVFAIRTHLPFFKSKPSIWLFLASLLAIAISVILPFTLFGQKFFEFVNLPWTILALIGGILVAYFITVELAKKYFFRKFRE